MIETREDPAGPGRMPVVFVGHGSPLNVIEENRWSRGFAQLSGLVPRPRSILSVSAHWFVDGTLVTGDDLPRTIHDFSGFPDALYEIAYPAPGDPDLAARVRALIGPDRVSTSREWGLDHGTWSVLRWMFPEADIPVVQLSIDRRLEPEQHLALGRALMPLREQGVLILGSGNVVHNLADAFRRKRAGETEPPDWARRFDAQVGRSVAGHDTESLLSAWPDGPDARLAHPSPDHWLPLLYTVGATSARDRVAFPVTGFDWSSLSMRSVVFG